MKREKEFLCADEMTQIDNELLESVTVFHASVLKSYEVFAVCLRDDRVRMERMEKAQRWLMGVVMALASVVVVWVATHG